MFSSHPPIPESVESALKAYRPLLLWLLACAALWVVLAWFWPRTVFYYFAASAGVLTALTCGLVYNQRLRRRSEDLEREELRRREELQEGIDQAHHGGPARATYVAGTDEGGPEEGGTI